MSHESYKVLESTDFDFIARKRRENYAYLHTLLNNSGDYSNNLPLEDGTIPLFYPTQLSSREKIKEYLANINIYCPIHWPKPKGIKSDNPLYRTELSIPIDQRYDKTDIDFIYESLIEMKGVS